MFSFAINKNEIIMTEFETVTSGSVNVYECNFNFSDDWEGLAKTVTFRAGYTKISVLLDNTNKCSIPWEVLAKDAVQLYCGVRGTVTPSDEEEEAIIPTMYCLLGTIRKGTELGDNAAPPEPSVVDQIMNRIEALDTGKQDKLTGKEGQVVGFDANGNAVAQDNKSPEYKAGENISITGGTISAKNSTYSIKKIDTTESGIAAAYNLINTDEEDTPVGDVIKIPEGYDDTGIRATLEIVSEKVDSNTDAIASNTRLISANTAEISNVAASVSNLSTTVSGIETNVSRNTDNISALSTTVAGIETNVSRNTENISALSTTVAGIETNVSRNTENISALSDSVVAAGNAIKKNTEDISSVSGNVSALSDSVAAAGNAIKKNTEDISSVSGKVDAVETNVSNLSNSKQDKITGKEGQIVGFNANGEPVAQDGGSGEPGKDGVTFVPMVSESGIISWTNDGGRENPEAVNIMGPKGASAGFGTVTATVDSNTGTPSVNVVATGPDTAKNLSFEFSNLKGKPGDPGKPGDKGDPGAAAGFGTVTATVTNTTGTPSVTVTTSGSNTAKNFDFAFSGLKGERADPASVPVYSIEQAAAADYPNYYSVYMMKKDGVALTPYIYIPRHGKYVGDLMSEFTHLDIASGSQAFGAAKFSTDWGLDIYYGKDSSNKALIYDFYLYPKTDSEWTLNLSTYKKDIEIVSGGLTYKVYNTGISSMRANNHMGKIFLLQAAASSFKVETWGSSGIINTTSTDRIYLYCEVSFESNMFQKYLVFTFKSLMSNPADRAFIGPNESCRLVQLS